jgi:hypothetical protein
LHWAAQLGHARACRYLLAKPGSDASPIGAVLALNAS